MNDDTQANTIARGIHIFQQRFLKGPPDCPEEPIFLLAAGWRSGSTLLQRLLTPHAFMWGEPYGAGWHLDGMMDVFRRVDESWPMPDFYYRGQSAEERSQSFIANLYAPPSQLLAAHYAFFGELFVKPARQAGSRRWGIKTVRLSADHAAYLKWLFPKSKLLFLIRNPYDAYRSYAARLANGSLWYNRNFDRPLNTEEFANHWVELATGFQKRAEHLGATIVRYEDIRAGDYQAIEQYLDLKLPAKIAEIRPVDGPMALDRIPTADFAKFDSIVGATAADLAYSARRNERVDAPGVSPATSAPRRRKQRVLFVWELGGGLGHLIPVAPLLKRLSREGHHVSVALRSLEHAKKVFGDAVTSCWQAPVKATGKVPNACTFAQILGNMCFGGFEELDGRTAAWQAIFTAEKPDLVIFDHAPTALLAASGQSFRKVLFGTGFCNPANISPFPDWRPELNTGRARLLEDERTVLGVINRWLDAHHLPLLSQVAELYHHVDDKILTTYPELDPFAPREDSYAGVWSHGSGQPPRWPEIPGPKVFGYLKRIPGLAKLLKTLELQKISSLLFIPSASDELLNTPSRYLNIVREPVDLQTACSECNFAILQGGHGTVAASLLAGAPLLLIPQVLEQRITTERLVDAGMAVGAGLGKAGTVASCINMLLADDSYRNNAQHFAAKHGKAPGEVEAAAYKTLTAHC